MNERTLTEGPVFKNLIRFSLPYLLSCFLQTFYGLADLFITGRFKGAASITAVSVGSQVTHMLTLVIVGLAMGSTVAISRCVGMRDRDGAAKAIGSSIALFSAVAAVLTAVLLLGTDGILSLLSVPAEARPETRDYLTVCFWGVPLITAYNVLGSIFRGLGDSRRPMYFIAAAGVVNVGLDYLLIGPCSLGAAGAAIATVIAQGFSVLVALLYIRRHRSLPLSGALFRPDRAVMGALLRVGLPVAAQDFLVQVAFLTVTRIANGRGLDVAAAVGIVEKIITFLFLVPSAMLSSVSAIAAQNAGALRHDRGRRTLFYAMGIGVLFGLIVAVVCQFKAEGILRAFSKEEPAVITLGAQYLRSYVFDCAFAAVHFCFSGYFCAYRRSMLAFAHNLASILIIRIPGAYLASLYFPETLYPMGLAAPLGSLLSALICAAAYFILRRRFSESNNP